MGTDLSLANLSSANLNWADLREANLRGADLWGANLWAARLRGTSFRGANLVNIRNVYPEQFSKVETLYKAKLEPNESEPRIPIQIKRSYPHLLRKPEAKKSRTGTKLK